MSEATEHLEDQNNAWLQRLWLRSQQPGVVRLAQTQATAVRLTHMHTPPLADEVSRRYAAVMAMQQQLPPIVFAEPVPAVQNEEPSGPKASSPLPIVTARAAAGASNPMPAAATRELPSLPVVQSAISPTQKTTSHTTEDRPTTTRGSVQPVPSITPETANVPLVPPIARSKSQEVPLAKPSAPPAAPTKGSAALSEVKTRPPQPEANDRLERPSPVLAVPTLPVGRVAGSPTLQPKSVPDVVQSHPVQVPNAAAQTTPDRPDNGRIPLPVAREQLTVAGPAATPLPPQPLPLAQPVGSVIQRAVQETAAKEKSPDRSASSPQPTPTPNRVVRANPVVQRATGDTGTAVSASGHEENDSPAETTPAISNLDMDELVEKVHRRFLRRLVVEGERRGKTVWP